MALKILIFSLRTQQWQAAYSVFEDHMTEYLLACKYEKAKDPEYAAKEYKQLLEEIEEEAREMAKKETDEKNK